MNFDGADGSGNNPLSRGTKRAAQGYPGRAFQPSSQGAPPSSGPRLSTFAPPAVGVNQRLPVPSALDPPRSRRPRLFHQTPARTADSSPISARRIVASAGSIPVKAARHDPPYWQTNEPTGRKQDGVRRVVAMSATNRFSHSDYRDSTSTKYAYANENVRKFEANIIMGKKAARKTEVQDVSSGDEEDVSTSESSESEDELEHSEGVGSDNGTESLDFDEEEADTTDSEKFRAPIIVLDDTPPGSPTLSGPPENVLVAVERLALPVACMAKLRRLPFLKRSLRRGFIHYCRTQAVPMKPDAHFYPVSVVFKVDDGSAPYETSMFSYECQLCQLHLPFPTKEVLQLHLEHSHPEVLSTWEDADHTKRWKLELLFSSESADEPLSSAGGSPMRSDDEVSIPGGTPEPAPLPNPLGPTARFPFLPAKSEFGGPDLEYSVRFGGPKIYDLLGLLPMEPYGILAWEVLDREEEIFESDDIPDEHKVMHALWARWIFLNRNLFIANYFKGAQRFIDEYWKMIRLAAGWDALRYMLLMLMTTRFLTTSHVALLLKHYARLCGE